MATVCFDLRKQSAPSWLNVSRKFLRRINIKKKMAYEERLESYFIANDIGVVDDENNESSQEESRLRNCGNGKVNIRHTYANF